LHAKTLGEAWLRNLKKVIEEGDWVSDEGVMLLEVRNVMTVIDSVGANDPIIERYADCRRIELMRKKYLSCKVVSPYRISYGKLLFDNNGVDQISWIVNRLKNKRESKSATISLHTPGCDELSCLSLLDFKIRNDELAMAAVYRSQNIFGSQPGNLLVLRTIQERVAEQVVCKAGSFTLLPISAHIYEADLEESTRITEEGLKLI